MEPMSLTAAVFPTVWFSERESALEWLAKP